jgi:beta-xylosidase
MKTTVFKTAAVAAFVLAVGAYAQETDTAYVPFKVNVNADVEARQGEKIVQKNVTANVTDTLKIPLQSSSSVWNYSGARGRLNAPAVMSDSRGNISLRLPPQSYQKAEIALYSVNGKRILRCKAAVSEAVSGVSRRNVAPGVYILSVKGIDGGYSATRLTHDGGRINVNVSFGAESVSPVRQQGKSAAEGDWTITVSAPNYIDSAYVLNPVKGTNNPLQNITLLPASPELAVAAATNPLIKGDVPDPSIIRVKDAYYMVSTTMYFTPVAPIMKSYDLVNWKIVSYCADILEDSPAFRLETETAARIGDYGRGQWASSLRYYNDRFWVIFTCLTTNKSYVFSTADPESAPWTRTVINRQFHDPSLFFDEKSNKMYVIHGNGNITLTEMETNLSGIKAGGVNKTIITSPDVNGGTGAEGAHVYYLNGYYYIFLISIWPRVELCYRSANIEGPYEGRLVLNKGLGGRTGGVAQGGIIQTPDGDWYGFLFQDRDGVGRVPVLVPVRWGNDNWPVFGDASGNVPVSFQIKQAQNYGQNIYVSDEFNETALPLAWQWNHNPDSSRRSLTARPGYLRLTTVRAARTIFHARNTLTQRTFEPACEGIVAMEPANMKDGDIAGLAALGPVAGFVGIEREGGQKYVVMYTADNDDATAGSNAATTRKAREAFTGDRIYFKLNFRFKADGVNTETAVFAYSADGTNWQNIGTTVNIRWTMSHFTGYRFGLFNYAAKETGGYVDFDYFRVR